jgi:dihydrofolate reductase
MRLFDWYSSGDTDYEMPGTEMVFRVSPCERRPPTGGARNDGGVRDGTEDVRHRQRVGWQPPLGVPSFVVTHTVPQEWVYEGSPFTFVTDGVESAIQQARAVAGGKTVAVGAASLAQQCLKLGLLDEIQIHLVPVLLGEGVRLFDHLGGEPIELESTRVIETPGVTHLTFRVLKED